MTSIVANPYQVGGMIRDRKQFIGREREYKEILSRVATMQNVSLVADGYKDHRFFYLDVQPIASAVECAGVLGSVAENVAAAMVGGLAGLAFGVITSVMSGPFRVMGVVLGVINGVTFGVELGVAVGLIASVAWGLGAIRLPFHVFELLPAVLAYQRSAARRNA